MSRVTCNGDVCRSGQPPPGELYWTHHWQKNFTIPELSSKQTQERWEDEDRSVCRATCRVPRVTCDV